jgi:flagellar secretion chaperone FliS
MSGGECQRRRRHEHIALENRTEWPMSGVETEIMWQDAHSAYLESRILSADPIELVRLVYQSAMEAIRDARRHLANQEILERARAISRASEILLELMESLDFERGGDISPQLAALYDYMLRRLTEANLKQSDAPLADVLALLATLLEAWEGISAPERPAAGSESPWAQAQSPPQEPVPASAEHAWSF